LGYESSSFAWSARISGLRQKVFNIASFRDNQEAIINATLDGRDVIVIMPTGGGKSLCYQLPALVSTGLTLVVSPLIALMDDQVMQLKELGIDAEAFTSESPNPAEIKAKLKQMCPITKRRRTNDPALDGDCKAIDLNAIPSGLRLLYASPEKIVTGKQFLALIEKIHSAGKLARIVIDECHCASEYGNDFRPDYSKLGILKYMFPEVPVIALSATCPPRVLDSVRKILGIQGGSGRPSAIVYTSPLWRQNLRYGVVRKTACLADQRMQLVKWITERHANDRGIVYCATKNNAYEVATQLYENDVKSYTVGLYYGNLEREKKEKLHEMWRNGQVQIIVATNAFGMGINSLDVRFVAHFTAPKTLENYYQESGRAGRDGAPADCVLFYRPTDSSKLVGWGFDAQAVDGLKKARAMVDYVECRHVCRKILLQEYLQGSPDALPPVQQSDPAQACGVCDICIKRPQ
ncbi:P-loop containing nucleoside triphosphate hydrolase protein, partial [Coemansia spiralis]